MEIKKVDDAGNITYYNERDQWHREDGPALIKIYGSKFWFFENKSHRLGGPADEHSDGTKAWWKKGQRHRLNAPAVIRPNASKIYWEFGVLIKQLY